MMIMNHSLIEFLKQIHQNSLTTFIFGPQQALLQSDQHGQIWFLDSRIESVSTIISYYLQLYNKRTNHSQCDEPISIHFSSTTQFDFLRSEFMKFFKLLHEEKLKSNAIHLHLPLNFQNNENHSGVLQEDLNQVFDFYQSISDLDLDSFVIYFSGNQSNQTVSINLSNLLGRLGFHFLHIYDENENNQFIINHKHQKTTYTQEIDNFIRSYQSQQKTMEELLDSSLFAFSSEIDGTNLINPYFHYTGSKYPTDIYILLNTYTSSQLAFTIKRLLQEEIKNKIGLIEIKVLKPWSIQRFLEILPASTKTIRVFSNQSDLVLNLISDGRSDHRRLQEIDIVPLLDISNLDSSTWKSRIHKDLGITDLEIDEIPRRLNPDESLITFWDLDTSTNDKPHILNRIASSFNSKRNQISNEYDNLSNLNSIRRHSIFISNQEDQNDLSIRSIIKHYSPTLLVIEDFKELNKTYDLFSKIGPTSNILFVSKNSNDFQDLETQIDTETRYKLWKNYSTEDIPSDQNSKAGILYNLDWVTLSDSVSLEKTIVIEIGALILVSDELNDAEILERIKLGISADGYEEEEKIYSSELIRKIRKQMKVIQIPDSWQHQEMNSNMMPEEQKITRKPDEIINTSTKSISLKDHGDTNSRNRINQTSIQKQILFPEYYQSNFSLRPDFDEKMYLLKVVENRRLTPKDYDRNVFHLSLSIKEANLNYFVGDALGIYGWNEETEIKSFIRWLNFNEDEIIEFNFSNEIDDEVLPQYMTIFKCFQQFLDLFGKPSKSFYETLSKKVTQKNEKDILRFIASSLGSSMMKKLTEVDKLNYIDSIKQYAKSHNLTIYDIISFIPLIKPRHYSIASSQNFKPDCIDLLIVEVNWTNSFGIQRKGQCTGYLNQLKIGDQVLVCLKDSVMRLPEVSTQPIIMAGLGTGMAPFRAFIQERAYQKNVKGLEIGPILYYFGSRSRFSEYLYGDEIENYLLEGIISHSRLSFSRDSPLRKKEYIQDLMRLDQKLIINMLLNLDGHFYLCGPTWPVQDIYNVILDGILMENELVEKEVGVKILEGLKNEERYVLEVY